MSLGHGWGWQPPKAASHIYIRHIQIVWAHWCVIHRHEVAALLSYPPYLAQIKGFWVTCRVNMMPLCHGWGWPPPQTASLIHTRHIQSVWAHWYAVHRQKVAALHSYPPWLAQILGFLVTYGVEWCHYIMVEAGSYLKLLTTSILYIYKEFEHINMLSTGIR
jgi:hypothetical protein